MKSLTLKVVLPLTILSFVIFTKWWYVQVEDWTDNVMHGFPLVCSSPGFGSSGSTQFFLLEFLVDILVYFSFWFLLIYFINRFIYTFRRSVPITVILYVLSGITVGLVLLIMILLPDKEIELQRPFNIQVIETGYKFIWEPRQRPDNFKNLGEEKNQ